MSLFPVCPFGDLQPGKCSVVEEFQCYDANISGTCCETCHEFEVGRNMVIDSKMSHVNRNLQKLPFLLRGDRISGEILQAIP